MFFCSTSFRTFDFSLPFTRTLCADASPLSFISTQTPPATEACKVQKQGHRFRNNPAILIMNEIISVRHQHKHALLRVVVFLFSVTLLVLVVGLFSVTFLLVVWLLFSVTLLVLVLVLFSVTLLVLQARTLKTSRKRLSLVARVKKRNLFLTAVQSPWKIGCNRSVTNSDGDAMSDSIHHAISVEVVHYMPYITTPWWMESTTAKNAGIQVAVH